MSVPGIHGAALLASSLLVAAEAAAAPFPTRDQNPFVTGFGLPKPLPARMPAHHQWTLEADLNWSSVSTADASGGEIVLVDLESRELRLVAARGLGERSALRVQLPYRYTGAGVLDSFIDGFHGLFGLPEGSRDDLPRDRLRAAYIRNGATIYDRTEASAGIGDLSLDAGYQLLTSERAAVSAWLSLKVPTGSAEELTGSGSLDAALSIAAERTVGERGSLFGQLSVAWLGDSEILPLDQRTLAWSGMIGGGYRLWRGLTLKVQLDARSGIFEYTQVDLLRSGTVLTLGGEYLFESGWRLDAGVSEDIDVGASPDVVFVFGLSRRME